MLVRADAGGGKANARIFLDVVDVFRDRADAERGMRGEDLRLRRDQDHRQQHIGIVVAELENVRRARRVIVGDEDRVAVRRALHRNVHAERAAGTGAVLDIDLLAEGR